MIVVVEGTACETAVDAAVKAFTKNKAEYDDVAYFDMFLLSHSFVAKMFVQLLLIYSTYKQEDLVENLHKFSHVHEISIGDTV